MMSAIITMPVTAMLTSALSVPSTPPSNNTTAVARMRKSKFSESWPFIVSHTLFFIPFLSFQYLGVTIQVPFSRRLRRPWKKKGILRGHPAPRPGEAVPRHPLLKSYLSVFLSTSIVNAHVQVLIQWLGERRRLPGLRCQSSPLIAHHCTGWECDEQMQCPLSPRLSLYQVPVMPPAVIFRSCMRHMPDKGDDVGLTIKKREGTCPYLVAEGLGGLDRSKPSQHV